MTTELVIDDIEQTRDALREDARRKLGVAGDEKTESFRRVIRKYGLSYYPMIALGLLFVTDTAVTDPPHDLRVGIDGSHGRNVFLAPATQDQTGSFKRGHQIILDHKWTLRHPHQALSMPALVS